MKHKFLLILFPLAFAFAPVFGASSASFSLNPEKFEKKKSNPRSIENNAKNSLSLGIAAAIAIAINPVLAICLGCSAFIYGHKALRRIRANPNELRGKRVAEASMVIGSIANPIGVIFLGGWLIADALKKLFRHKKGIK
ncbi:MAG: hypothetical protein H7246_17195 [Phycisphaerae bacterium]|nr:hypothetical protein [Saprospiraceae bacterium]